MNLEDYIKSMAVKLKASRRTIYIAPDIPEKILEKYSRALGESFSGELVLVASYTSVGCFALTGKKLYYNNFMQGGMKCIEFIDVSEVSAQRGRTFSPDTVNIKLKDGQEICLDASVDGIDVDVFASVFAEIIKFSKNNELVESRQAVPLYELPENIKLIYLKILCNYAYFYDEMVDAREYNSIIKFSIRIGLEASLRSELRDYMNLISERKKVKTGYFIHEVNNELEHESGKFDAFRYSIIQDLIYLHNLNYRDIPWRKDIFLVNMMKSLSIKPQQADSMLKAIEFNERMLKKDSDFVELNKEFHRFTESIRYTDGYVSSMYLLCSGSIYRFSNMAQILAVFGSEKKSKEEINKQRELILQQEISNLSSVINILSEDMNFLAEKLQSAADDSQELKQRYLNLISRLNQAINCAKSNNGDKE